jgi:hypothetical protein
MDEESLSENELEAAAGGGETPIRPPGFISERRPEDQRIRLAGEAT